jgi:hypothetical protein
MDARIMVRNDRRLRHRRGCARVLSCAGLSLALLALANRASAYSVSTHIILTGSATLRSQLNGPILSKLGYELGERFPALAVDSFGAGELPPKTAVELIDIGAVSLPSGAHGGRGRGGREWAHGESWKESRREAAE